MLIAFGMPGLPEILIILAVVVLLFGTKKIPELARSLGKAKGEFKKGIAEGAAADKPSADADGDGGKPA